MPIDHIICACSINVGSLILSASKFKCWAVSPAKLQTYLFDFLVSALETLEEFHKKYL